MLNKIFPGKLKSFLLDRNRVKIKTIDNKEKELDNAVIIRKCWYKWGLDALFKLEDISDQAAMIKAARIFSTLTEATYEIEDSIFAVIHGAYKQAMTSLRSALELFFLGLYYYDHPQEYVVSYIKGKSRTVNLRNALYSLFDQTPYKEFNEKYFLQQEILNINDGLSQFVHARGAEQQSLNLRHKPPVNFKVGDRVKIDLRARGAKYDEELFDRWYDQLCRMSIVVNISLILKYPNILKSLHSFAVVLPEDRLAQLKQVLRSSANSAPIVQT